MSAESFRDLARPLIDGKDMALLERLSLEPGKKTGCKLVDDWQDWERSLRLNLAKQREKKINRKSEESSGQQNETHVSLPVVLKEASSVAMSAAAHEGTPLEIETYLDKERWATIELLSSYNYFSKNNVFAYYLKLLLLERRQLFNAEIGFAEYKSLYTQIIESPHEYIENGGHISTGEHE
jgi:hypothetical protein